MQHSPTSPHRGLVTIKYIHIIKLYMQYFCAFDFAAQFPSDKFFSLEQQSHQPLKESFFLRSELFRVK